jgi:hypothetical protein
MDSKAMTRKDFITLTFTLIGSGVALDACSSSNNNTTGTAGTTGTSTGAAGTTGVGGHAGTTGAGGTTGSAGTTGTAGTTGAGGTGASACADPLPEMQLTDTTGHMHTVSVPASTLSSATPQTFNTSVTLAHMHMVTLAVVDLAAIKAGGSATVTSTPSPVDGHMHMFKVSCT